MQIFTKVKVLLTMVQLQFKLICQPWITVKFSIPCTHFRFMAKYKSIIRAFFFTRNHSTHIWWRHQMETFSALLALCAGNSPVNGENPTQRPVTRSFDVFFDLRLNRWLSKQTWGWWFETPSWPLWRYCNEMKMYHLVFAGHVKLFARNVFSFYFSIMM